MMRAFVRSDPCSGIVPNWTVVDSALNYALRGAADPPRSPERARWAVSDQGEASPQAHISDEHHGLVRKSDVSIEDGGRDGR